MRRVVVCARKRTVAAVAKATAALSIGGGACLCACARGVRNQADNEKTKHGYNVRTFPSFSAPFRVSFRRPVRFFSPVFAAQTDDGSPIETPAAGSAKRTRRRRPRPDMNRSVRFSPYPGDGDGLKAVLCGVNAVGSARRSDEAAGRHTGSGPQVRGYSTAADGAVV